MFREKNEAEGDGGGTNRKCAQSYSEDKDGILTEAQLSCFSIIDRNFLSVYGVNGLLILKPVFCF